MEVPEIVGMLLWKLLLPVNQNLHQVLPFSLVISEITLEPLVKQLRLINPYPPALLNFDFFRACSKYTNALAPKQGPRYSRKRKFS